MLAYMLISLILLEIHANTLVFCHFLLWKTYIGMYTDMYVCMHTFLCVYIYIYRENVHMCTHRKRKKDREIESDKERIKRLINLYP